MSLSQAMGMMGCHTNKNVPVVGGQVLIRSGQEMAVIVLGGIDRNLHFWGRRARAGWGGGKSTWTCERGVVGWWVGWRVGGGG